MKNIYDCIVIGTGPSGLSATWSLLKRKKDILVIEQGDSSDLQDQTSDIASWYLKLIRAPQGLKPEKGSLKVYDVNLAQIDKNLLLISSALFGGFSRVWGRVFLPFSSNEYELYPGGLEKISKYIELVKTHLVHSSLTMPPTSTSDVQLFGKFENVRDKRVNIVPAAIAFNKSVIDVNDCKTCGHCIVGCPKNYLFSTNYSFKKLLDENVNLSLKYGTKVLSIKEHNDVVTVECEVDSKKIFYHAKKVFLGAGVYQSLRILGAQNSYSVTIKDSAYYIVPLFSFKSLVPKALGTVGHSLCKWVLELPHLKYFLKPLKIQIYTHNEVYERLLRSKYKLSMKFLTNRMALAQIFFDSLDSPEIVTSIDNGQFHFFKTRNPPGFFKKQIYLRFFLFLYLLKVGLICFPFFWIKKRAGSSFHSGANFPMESKTLNSSDKLGRIAGYKNIHLIDASVLPTIPAGSLTLTVMANAMRIADDAEI